MLKVKHISEWSIVRLPDGRQGVLSHHYKPDTKSLVMFSDGSGAEVKRTDILEVVVHTATGMRDLLRILEQEPTP